MSTAMWGRKLKRLRCHCPHAQHAPAALLGMHVRTMRVHGDVHHQCAGYKCMPPAPRYDQHHCTTAPSRSPGHQEVASEKGRAARSAVGPKGPFPSALRPHSWGPRPAAAAAGPRVPSEGSVELLNSHACAPPQGRPGSSSRHLRASQLPHPAGGCTAPGISAQYRAHQRRGVHPRGCRCCLRMPAPAPDARP
jgi:hypothetical protein